VKGGSGGLVSAWEAIMRIKLGCGLGERNIGSEVVTALLD